MKIQLLVAIVMCATVCVAQQPFSARPDFTAAGALAKFTLDGNGTWEIADGKLVLSKAGIPGGPIRRPAALAILQSEPLVRATVRVDMRSTAAVEVKNRDLEIIFGYVSPTRFYYVHLAGITNDVHNGIFLVDDKDRRRIDDGKAAPQLTDREWHQVRLERDGASGRIEVFVDGSKEPALKATDTSIRSGRVGLGSFDDTGEFRKFDVSGSAGK
jgi:hypothetical protein